jgi:hypothetical protein
LQRRCRPGPHPFSCRRQERERRRREQCASFENLQVERGANVIRRRSVHAVAMLVNGAGEKVTVSGSGVKGARD